jgi:hypothetical protein
VDDVAVVQLLVRVFAATDVFVITGVFVVLWLFGLAVVEDWLT